MESILCTILALFFLMLPLWWLNKHKWGRLLIIQPMKRVTWFLVRVSFKLLMKVLRKVPSLFDPY